MSKSAQSASASATYAVLPTGVLTKRLANFAWSSLDRERLIAVTKALTKGTTKICPHCLSQSLLEFSSLAKKVCGECGAEIPWTLGKGQKPKA